MITGFIMFAIGGYAVPFAIRFHAAWKADPKSPRVARAINAALIARDWQKMVKAQLYRVE